MTTENSIYDETYKPGTYDISEPAIDDTIKDEELEDYTEDIFEEVTEENAAELDTDRLMSVPTDINVPKWLSGILMTERVPGSTDYKNLIELGERVYRNKVMDIEFFNMDHQGGKRPIPSKIDFVDIAIVLMSMYTFKLIKLTDSEDDTILSVYAGDENAREYGTYVSNVAFLKQIIERIAPNTDDNEIEKVVSKISRSVSIVEPEKDRNLFAVKNGVFNQKTMQLEPHSPDRIFRKKIPVNYNPNAVNPVIEMPDGAKWDVVSWIRDLMNNDDDSEKLIWQVIADSIQGNYSRDKAIWFYSEKGNNGKGTLGQMIKTLVGRGNYATLSVMQYKHEYASTKLIEATLNIADENDPNIYIDSVQNYKAAVTGDDIMINRKYKDPISIRFLGTDIQMLNGLPKTKDTTGSFYRRLIIVPFLQSFTNNGERKYIKDDYITREDVLEYVLVRALHVDAFDEFIIPKVSADLLAEYRVSNNPIMDFWNEYKDQFVWDLLPNRFLFDCYKVWLDRTNPSRKAESQASFMKTLINVVEEQNDGWVSTKTKHNPSGKVRPGDRMDKEEKLIFEFGFDKTLRRDGNKYEWIQKEYHGGNKEMILEAGLKDTYVGLERK